MRIKVRRRRRARKWERHKWEKLSFGGKLFKAAPTLVVAVLLTLALTRWGGFAAVEPVVQDALMRLDSTEEDRVAVVDIDEADYKTLFDETSPLKLDRLSELLDAIARARPAVIGVDIKTASEHYRAFQLKEWDVPVVWLQQTREREPEGEFGLWEKLAGSHVRSSRFEPLAVLGRDDPALLESSGVERFLSQENVVRLYRRMWETASPEGRRPSFAWAVLKRLPAAQTAGLEPSTDPLYISFTGGERSEHRWRLSAGHALSMSREKAWSEDGPLTGRVVLLGGSYGEQDLHETPVGKMHGIYVHANIVETELRRRGFRPLATGALVALQLAEGVGLVLLFHLLPFGRAVLVAALLIPIAALLLSLITSLSLERWAYFAPVLYGVVAYHSFEHFKDFVKELVRRVLTYFRRGR